MFFAFMIAEGLANAARGTRWGVHPRTSPAWRIVAHLLNSTLQFSTLAQTAAGD